MTDPNAPQQPEQPAYPPVQQPAQPQYQQPAYPPVQQPVYGQPVYAVAPTGPKVLSITSMSLGIASVVLGWIPFADFLAFVAGIVAIILGARGLKREPAGKGFAITGLITGSVGLLFALISGIILIIGLAIAATAIGTAGGLANDAYQACINAGLANCSAGS